MNVQNFIPAVDPNPIPGPFWLFKLLLLVTFFLHILAMNLMLGGTIIAFFARLKKDSPWHQKLYDNLKHKLPNLLPATITLGVAPLLFVQLLYGQFLYVSTIIIGWFWFAIIILLTVAYYGFYYVSFKKDNGKISTLVLLGSLLLILVIAFIYTSNALLYMQPQHWATQYFSDPGGKHLFWNDVTLLPRYLHVVVGALAIGGLMVAFIGVLKKKREPEFAGFLIKSGSRWFVFATMAQFFIGNWFLISLPKPQMMLFMGQHRVASLFLILGLVLTLVTIFMVTRTVKKDVFKVPVVAVSILTLFILAMMIFMRDVLRDSYLQEFFAADRFQYAPQWSVLLLFLVLFGAGVVVWLWMLKKFPFQAESSTNESDVSG